MRSPVCPEVPSFVHRHTQSMFKRSGVLFLLCSIAYFRSVTGHPESKTPEQVKAYQDLQAAAYHCTPSISRHIAERQSQFAQHVLTGSSDQYKLSSDRALFDGEGYDDVGPQKLLACTPVEERKIRNQTCVLGKFTFLSRTLLPQVNESSVPRNVTSTRSPLRPIL